ncbi:MAG TPA: hypothetical protein VJ436_05520 [Anaerolineales bacterium]|nr:hypothetical protein [Anaerolineales bacterium]
MKSRSSLATALTLIGIGSWFLAIEISPQVKVFAYGANNWPLPIIGIGVYLALIALLTWTPDLMMPAVIVSGIGSLLAWQNATGNWGSWAYAWALIPGFIGLGMVISGLLSRDRKAAVGGGWMIVISLVLFGIFGSFLGGSILVLQYWPILLIVLGVVLLAQGVFRRR